MSSTAVITHDSRLPSNRNDVKTLVVDIIADSSDGGIDDVAIDSDLYGIRNHYLYSVETVPGTTNPTASYDLTVVDEDALDIANSQLLNRSASLPELINIGAGDFGYPIVHGDLTLKGSGNNVVSAEIKVILKFVKR